MTKGGTKVIFSDWGKPQPKTESGNIRITVEDNDTGWDDAFSAAYEPDDNENLLDDAAMTYNDDAKAWFCDKCGNNVQLCGCDGQVLLNARRTLLRRAK